ncbi:MAG: Wzt carbohydrate-binding domain-containing protein [Deltaproteobacteria bacterium]|nr:Wzt carbohydrate-binding domain-containing protein [Deltaproteobacteria bacterium]
MSGSNENIIIVRNLTKVYKLYTDYKYALIEYLLFKKKSYHMDFYALRDISFDVSKGSILGIIGDNGAGKSLLLKILAGSVLPTSGSAIVNGSVSSLIDLQSGFKRDFTGIDNIKMNLVISGYSGKKYRYLVDRIAEFSELGDFLKYPISSYSTGMLMRLGFSISSNLVEDVFIVDEHIAVGDNYFMRKCIDKLKELNKEKKTLVMVSHNMHLIANLSTKVIWLDSGVIREMGDPPTIVRNYEDYILKRENKGDSQRIQSVPDKARITGVKILDRKGTEKYVFDTEEDILVEVEAHFYTRIQRPVFGVAIFKEDGRYIYGPNTYFDRFDTGICEGPVRFSIVYEKPPLLNGKYLVSVAIFDPDHLYHYDFHEKRYSFEIKSDILDHGDIKINHRWFIERG